MPTGSEILDALNPDSPVSPAPVVSVTPVPVVAPVVTTAPGESVPVASAFDLTAMIEQYSALIGPVVAAFGPALTRLGFQELAALLKAMREQDLDAAYKILDAKMTPADKVVELKYLTIEWSQHADRREELKALWTQIAIQGIGIAIGLLGVTTVGPAGPLLGAGVALILAKLLVPTPK